MRHHRWEPREAAAAEGSEGRQRGELREEEGGEQWYEKRRHEASEVATVDRDADRDGAEAETEAEETRARA